MKKVLPLLLAIIALILIGFLFWDPTDDTEDLGELDNAILNVNKTYCKYEITKVNCEQPTQYVVGDIICIECCVNAPDPWPERVGVNNNCYKKIKFEQALNVCKIEAKRLKQTCTNCIAAETKAVFECPNQ